MQINSAIFISDLHLNKNEPEKYKHTLEFLRTLEGKTEYLFLLGDIFEFWYNDRKALLEEYSEVLSVFKKLSSSGIKLYFFEGNHDICYGDYIKNELKAKVYRKSINFKINDYNVFLGHGDDLIINDIRYRILRTTLRLKIIKFIISYAPSKLVLKTALLISKLSKKFSTKKRQNLNDIYKKIAAQKIEDGTNVLILGHTHIPEAAKIGNGLYLNCGDWIENATYVEFKNNCFSLKNTSL